MTGETRKERTSEEGTSVAPKLSNNHYSNAQVKYTGVPMMTQRLGFFYSHPALSAELLGNIDKKWEACWPINMLRPLVLLDLISYLLFIKELDERQLIFGNRTEASARLYIKEKNELSWSTFKEIDSQRMYEIFTKEKGLCDLMKNYGNTSLKYSLFVKEPLLLNPTAAMLTNMVDMVKIMEAESSDTKAAIFEYLLNKAEIVAQNGQVYAPEYVVKLVVALMQPSPDDVIGDPSAGNGSFLVTSAMYMANKNSTAIPPFKKNSAANIYRGIESDLIQLRIGAMNMILHGIEDPKLESLNVLSKINLNIREQPTLILSNLFFEATEEKPEAGANTPKPETRSQEIRLLNFILKSLKSGGRTAIITREIILYDNLTEIKTIRQQIIDNHKLEAVISLPGKTGSLFSGACILIFTKSPINTTDKVWFYKMDTGKKEINKSNTESIDSTKNDTAPFIEEYGDVADILSLWKNEKEESGRTRTGKSFYVPVDEIIANNYNLGFNEYKKNEKESEQYAFTETAAPDDTITPRRVKLKLSLPDFKKIKLPKKKLSVNGFRVKKRLLITLITIVIICIGLALYFFYFNKNNTVTTGNINTNAPAVTKNTIPTITIKPKQPAPKSRPNAQGTAKLSPEQIKTILKDTTGIINFQQPTDVSSKIKDSAKVLVNNSSTADNLADEKTGAVTAENGSKIKYTVVDTTFFHDQPDERTRRSSFLDPLNHNILDPVKDENGFIFIVYTNRFGRTSKGWINKKDLRPVQ